MRLWSIHPKYLDKIGLVALWREALLARKVLEGKTIGYKNHPQLERFKNYENPLIAINTFLKYIYKEGINRGYKFDSNKLDKKFTKDKIKVNSGQIEYEFSHLLNKLKTRDKDLYNRFKNVKTIDPNPLFTTREGGIEEWEKIDE